MQGTCLASWLYYEGVAVEAKTTAAWYNQYKKDAERLLALMTEKESAAVNHSPAELSDFALHPDIIAKCSSLYNKGEYAEAVEKSFKTVRDTLRRLTGHETGSDAFGKGKLHIVGAVAPNVDADFNQAVKFLKMGLFPRMKK